MNGDSFTPDERRLIERLSKAPQPDLTPDTFEAIRVRMLDAMDAPPAAPDTPRLRPPVNMAVAAGVVAIVVIVIVIIIAIATAPRTEELSEPTLTAAPTQTLLVPTSTPIPVEGIVTEEATVELTPDVSDTPTPTITVTASPAFTPTATLESVIVIQAPVQSVDGNVVIFYGISITFDPDDPLLDVIRTGDIIRVEAIYQTETNLIVAVKAEYVNQGTSPEVNVNPDTGEAWRDNGNCDNPPPPWATANGWRRRCEGQSGSKKTNKH